MAQPDHLRRIRFWLAVFIAGLVLSGITAFPLQTELGWLVSLLHAGWLKPIAESTGLLPWIERVNEALTTTNAHYPFLAYETDWLAFAHLETALVEARLRYSAFASGHKGAPGYFPSCLSMKSAMMWLASMDSGKFELYQKA
jgi:hypothetical protein